MGPRCLVELRRHEMLMRKPWASTIHQRVKAEGLRRGVAVRPLGCLQDQESNTLECKT